MGVIVRAAAVSAPEAFFTKHREFTIEKARRELGYEPKVDLQTGIRRTAEWYVEEGLLQGVSLADLQTASGRAA